MAKDIYILVEKDDADKVERVALSVADMKYLYNSLLKLSSTYGENKEMRRMINLMKTKLLF
jgi:hypothetical protein